MWKKFLYLSEDRPFNKYCKEYIYCDETELYCLYVVSDGSVLEICCYIVRQILDGRDVLPLMLGQSLGKYGVGQVLTPWGGLVITTTTTTTLPTTASDATTTTTTVITTIVVTSVTTTITSSH